MKKTTLAIYSYKQSPLIDELNRILPGMGIEIVNSGISDNSNNYNYIKCAAELVSSSKVDGAIVISAFGFEGTIVGCKYPNVRASLVYSATTAKYTRQHNNSNLLCISDSMVGMQKSIDIITEWLKNDFIGGRHQISVDLIGTIEQHTMPGDHVIESNRAKFPFKRIYVGSDHAGYEAKLHIMEILGKHDIVFTNIGTFSYEIVRYPYYASQVDQAILSGQADGGILICGTGVGISLAANKYKGIRATLCNDVSTARIARERFDSNVLCIGGKVSGLFELTEIVETWLSSQFNSENQDTIEQINFVESINMRNTNWAVESNV